MKTQTAGGQQRKTNLTHDYRFTEGYGGGNQIQWLLMLNNGICKGYNKDAFAYKTALEHATSVVNETKAYYGESQTKVAFVNELEGVTLRLWDTIEKSYLWDMATGNLMMFKDEKMAQQAIDDYFDAGNYPDRPSSVIEIHAFVDGKFYGDDFAIIIESPPCQNHSVDKRDRIINLLSETKQVNVFEHEGRLYKAYRVDAVKAFIKNNPTPADMSVWFQQNLTELIAI